MPLPLRAVSTMRSCKKGNRMKYKALVLSLIWLMNSFLSLAVAQQRTRQTPSQPKTNQSSPNSLLPKVEDTQNPNSQTQEQPSLQETINWLQEQITAYAGITANQQGMSLSFRYDNIRFNGCTLMYKSSTKTK